MAKILVSYSHEDTLRVRQLVMALEGNGHEVWWDRQLLPGQTWEEVLHARIRASDVVIVVWSAHSVRSDFVRDEATQSKANNKLVPVAFDSVAPPLGFGQLHTTDLTRWLGGSDAEAINRVAAAINNARPMRSVEPKRAGKGLKFIGLVIAGKFFGLAFGALAAGTVGGILYLTSDPEALVSVREALFPASVSPNTRTRGVRPRIKDDPVMSVPISSLLSDLLLPPASAQDQRRAQGADIGRSRAGQLVQEAVTRAARGDIDGQERLATEAAMILRRLMARSPDDIELPRELSVALNKIGEARHSKGNAAGAAEAFTEGLRLIEQLQAKFADRPLLQRDAYVPQVWLGNLALEAGRLDEAEAAYRQGLALIDRALAADLKALNIPDHVARLASIDRPSLERERATAMNKLGDVAAARGDHAGALRHYEASHALRQRLVEADPSDGLLFRQLNVSKGNIGLTRYALGHLEGAAAIFEEALAGWREMLKSDPNNASHQRDLSIGLNQLGSTLLQLGQHERARRILGEDLDLTRSLSAKDHTNAGLKQELLTSVARMAQVALLPPPDLQRACNLLGEADKLRREGVATAPDVSEVLAQLKQAVGTCRPIR